KKPLVSGEYWISVDMTHMVLASYFHAESSISEDKYQSMRTDRMATGNLTVGMIILLQTILGILGNLSLLYHCLLLYFTGCGLMPTDLLVKNLIVANSLVLFSREIPDAMPSFGDFGCRYFSYVRGVGRGVSISTTCLLSVFQAIMISPRNSSTIITMCFPTVSPFLLMSHDSNVSGPCFVWIRNTKSPNLMRKM
ncbi:hypothetical protein HPG69_013987, partial [Diceros bicornis minor]